MSDSSSTKQNTEIYTGNDDRSAESLSFYQPMIDTYSRIYGNNLCILNPTNRQEDCIIVALDEIPPLSMSCTWREEQRWSLATKMADFVNSDEYVDAALLLSDEKALTRNVAGAEFTTRTYSQPSRVNFNLKFRIYSKDSGEVIGPGGNVPMTSYDKILTLLAWYASPKSNNNLEGVIGQMAHAVAEAANTIADNVNFKNAAEGASQAWSATKDLFNTLTSESTDTSVIAAAGANISEGINKIATWTDKRINNIVNDIENDAARVKSPQNTKHGMFGANVWQMIIWPGVFRQLLTVAITDYTYKPSKEIDYKGNALYIDFTISCEMDQIKPAIWWDSMIVNNDGVAHKQKHAPKLAQYDKAIKLEQ